MDKWNSLSDPHQAMIETACAANLAQEIADGEASQFQAMIDNEKSGVKNMTWTDEQIGKFRAAWDEVVVDEIADNPDAQKVWKSYNEFHDKYKVWGDRGYLK